MSDLLPAVRPRGRHANPDVAVDAPSAASVAPTAAPASASPDAPSGAAEPLASVIEAAEPVAAEVPPTEAVVAGAVPAVPVVADSLAPASVADVAHVDPAPDELVAPAEPVSAAEPFDEETLEGEPDVAAPSAEVSAETADPAGPDVVEPAADPVDPAPALAETHVVEAELINDRPLPSAVDAVELLDEPLDEPVAAPVLPVEAPVPAAPVTSADSIAAPATPATSAWAPPPWEAPIAPAYAPAEEAATSGLSSFAPPLATAVLDGPAPVQEEVQLPAPVPAVSNAAAPAFFGLVPTAAASTALAAASDPEVEAPVGAGTSVDGTVEPAAADTTTTPRARRQRGRAARGVLLALLIIPVGITAWVLLWNFGFITSVVAFGISWGAVGLYRLGSRSRVTTGALWSLIGIITVTLALAFLGGIASDIITTSGLDPLVAATSTDFWAAFVATLGTAELWETYAINLAVAALFAGLGCFSVLKSLRPESRA